MDADRTMLPHGEAARVRRHKYFAQQNPGAGAIHLLRACPIPLGLSGHRERNPKIRPSAKGRWSYFWCGHGDSNPNAVKHENLKVMSPQWRIIMFHYSSGGRTWNTIANCWS